LGDHLGKAPLPSKFDTHRRPFLARIRPCASRSNEPSFELIYLQGRALPHCSPHVIGGDSFSRSKGRPLRRRWHYVVRCLLDKILWLNHHMLLEGACREQFEPDVSGGRSRCAILKYSGYDAASASPLIAEIVLRRRKFDLIVLSGLSDFDLHCIIALADGAELLVLEGVIRRRELLSSVAQTNAARHCSGCLVFFQRGRCFCTTITSCAARKSEHSLGHGGKMQLSTVEAHVPKHPTELKCQVCSRPATSVIDRTPECDEHAGVRLLDRDHPELLGAMLADFLTRRTAYT
jgi:hypothetical protein